MERCSVCGRMTNEVTDDSICIGCLDRADFVAEMEEKMFRENLED
jgi:hypothetical protein